MLWVINGMTPSNDQMYQRCVDRCFGMENKNHWMVCMNGCDIYLKL